MAKQKKQVKRNFRRTIDLVFLLILLFISLYAFYNAYTFKMLPRKWIFIFIAFVSVIYLILFVLALKKMPTWFVVIKRIFIVLLAAVLATSGYFVNRTKTTVDKIATVNSDTKTEIYIITNKDSNIASITDLSDKVIGYQSGTDTANATYAKQQIEGSTSNTDSYEELDYTSLYNDLITGGVDAVAISKQYYNMTKSNQKEFDDNIKIIHTFEKDPETVESKLDITEDVFTIYISGLDNAGSPDQIARSDVNLLMIVNPKANHIDMVSLPRDGLVPNTATYNENDKLTHTGIYGMQASIDSIENFIGIPIDYYARMSFTSVSKIIDAIGGIDIDVEINFCGYDETDYRATEEVDTHEGQEVVCINQGEKQHLSGAQALMYARIRHIDGVEYDNPGRQRAQQRVIKGVINKLVSPSALTYLDTLMDIAPNFVITNMPNDQIQNFVSAELNDLRPWTISSITSDTGVNGKSYVASLSKEYGLLDVYLFSKDEIHAIQNFYDGAKKQLQMNSFKFNLNDLNLDTPALITDSTFEWADDAQY